MATTKHVLLEKATEIIKEAARSGNYNNLPLLLQNIYEKLKELNEDTREE